MMKTNWFEIEVKLQFNFLEIVSKMHTMLIWTIHQHVLSAGL